MELPILYFKDSRSFKIMMYSVINMYFILANSADPNEMSHYATFHQGLHCLPKYLFAGTRMKRLRDANRLWSQQLSLFRVELVNLFPLH